MDLARRKVGIGRESYTIRATSTSTNASDSTLASMSTCSLGSTSTFASSAPSTFAFTSTRPVILSTVLASVPQPLKLVLGSGAKVVDPDGDIIAILLPTTFTFQISSKVLSIASPVLKRMFFLSGRDIRELVEVVFKGDSPRALEVILCVLHHRHECISTNMTHHQLYDIAVVAYKYGFMGALGPWKEIWLKSGAGEGGSALFVRHVFGDRKGFEQQCREMIMQSLGYDEKGGERGEGEESRLGIHLLPNRVRGMISLLASYYAYNSN